jgi:hypothetical protein
MHDDYQGCLGCLLFIVVVPAVVMFIGMWWQALKAALGMFG